MMWKSGFRTENFLNISTCSFQPSMSHRLDPTLSASNRGRRNTSRSSNSRILFIYDVMIQTPYLQKNQPTYHIFTLFAITYLPHFSHHIPTALFTTFALCTSTYLPHFSYPLHHLPSPIYHTFLTHLPSPTYHTFHIIRPSNLHLSTVLFTPFSVTYVHLSVALS